MPNIKPPSNAAMLVRMSRVRCNGMGIKRSCAFSLSAAVSPAPLRRPDVPIGPAQELRLTGYRMPGPASAKDGPNPDNSRFS